LQRLSSSTSELWPKEPGLGYLFEQSLNRGTD
jgi:hypothetical protein